MYKTILSPWYKQVMSCVYNEDLFCILCSNSIKQFEETKDVNI